MTGHGFDARSIEGAKATQRGHLLRALAGLPADVETPEPEPPRKTSMDGGVRRSVPLPPPTHGETLIAILRSREADVGRFLG
jgi:hypothetical protein